MGVITGTKNKKKPFRKDRNTKDARLRPVNSLLSCNTKVNQLKSYFNGILQ